MKIYKISQWKRDPERWERNPEIIRRVLQENQEDLRSQYAVMSLNCPPDVIEMVLKRNKNGSIVSGSASKNPNCPVYLLEEILKRGEQNWVTFNAALNPSCPVYLLEEILKRGEDDRLSRCCASNPNCPALAKINWMRATGRIEKEDPSKHIIEREEVKEDEDLKKLRDLISSNNSWYKTSQENYYTKKIARNPNTSPEILKKILEKGNDGSISWYAAGNPNCPGQALEMVLKRGKDDDVSRNAALNPNCPPEALEMVLKRGKDDYVSYYAAKNPNCPPEALEMVLKRGNDDFVSRNAAKNPNCPALAKIQWMRLTGKIGQFDPSKHIMESDEKEYKEDPDLQKLRALIK